MISLTHTQHSHRIVRNTIFFFYVSYTTLVYLQKLQKIGIEIQGMKEITINVSFNHSIAEPFKMTLLVNRG